MENLAILFEVALHNNSEESKIQWKAVKLSTTLKRFTNGTGGYSLRDAMRHHTLQNMVACAAIPIRARATLPNLSVLCDETLHELMCSLEQTEREQICEDHEKWHQTIPFHPLYAAKSQSFVRKAPAVAPSQSALVVIKSPRALTQLQKKNSTIQQLFLPLIPSQKFVVGQCTCANPREHYDHLLFEKQMLMKAQNKRRDHEYDSNQKHIKQNEHLEHVMHESKARPIKSAQLEHATFEAKSALLRSMVVLDPLITESYGNVRAKVKSYNRGKYEKSVLNHSRGVEIMTRSQFKVL